MSQVAASQFASQPLGHDFIIRKPLGKATAKKCRECNRSVFDHHVSEVDDADLARILEALADATPSEILEGELYVGAFKSVIALQKRVDKKDGSLVDKKTLVINTAGRKLNEFMPLTKAPFEKLRDAGRLLDVEWEDRDDFVIDKKELLTLLQKMKQHTLSHTTYNYSKDGSRSSAAPGTNKILVNCAQGKSRSGTLAVAYVMARNDLSVDDALKLVKGHRATVGPNPGFLRQLREMEDSIRKVHNNKP